MSIQVLFIGWEVKLVGPLVLYDSEEFVWDKIF